jgi:hypothetical protein
MMFSKFSYIMSFHSAHTATKGQRLNVSFALRRISQEQSFFEGKLEATSLNLNVCKSKIRGKGLGHRGNSVRVTIDPDTPIHRADDDRFGYDILACQLVPNLILKCGEGSLVAGVEAPWGSGKTSFLNLVRNEVTEINKDALVLPYCPWIYSNRRSTFIRILHSAGRRNGNA